jgi:surface antigen
MQGGSCRFLVVVGAVALLYGCAMSGFDLEKAVPDKSTITGSVNKQPVTEITDSSKMSDQNTIRNVVSALNFTQWGKTPIPWANPDTGSQGTITTVAEKKTEAGLCREFETSREAFDGAALYRGQACMAQGGAWALTSFAPL